MSVRRWAILVVALLISLVLAGCEPPKTTPSTGGGKPKTTKTTTTTKTTQTGASVRITTSKKTCWAGRVGATSKKGCGSASFQVKTSNGAYTVNLRKTTGSDGLTVVLVVKGKKVDSGRISSSSSVV
ncbi:MAG TPA: hypothetical protein VFI00_09655, partial [Kribbella sp.]|nr:hypothetical protein [Kribbella sp.]